MALKEIKTKMDAAREVYPLICDCEGHRKNQRGRIMTRTEQQTAARRRQAEKEQAARFARAGAYPLHKFVIAALALSQIGGVDYHTARGIVLDELDARGLVVVDKLPRGRFSWQDRADLK